MTEDINPNKAPADPFADIPMEEPLAATKPDENPFDDADFKDFSQTTNKVSFTEMWNTNPFMKIGVIIGGVVLLIGAYLMFGNKAEPPQSNVSKTAESKEAPGGNVSESYRSAVEEVNQQRLETAVQTGGSAIPIPLAGPTIPPTDPANPPATPEEDPLAQWRQTAAAPTPEPTPPAAPVQQPVQQGQQQPVQNPYQASMQQQMQNILGGQGIRAPKIMQVTTDAYMQQGTQKQLEGATPGNTTAGTAQTKVQKQEILIPAGSVNYGVTMLEANSDIPGPVMVKLESGPFKGSKLLGSFQTTDDYLVITFNTLVDKGISRPINAIALDPNTTLNGMATEYDGRYVKRVLLPAAAEFMRGFAQAVTDYGSTNVSVNGDTVATETKKLNTKEQVYAGVGRGVESIGTYLSDEASKTKPLVKVGVGTAVGILFLDPVLKSDGSNGNGGVTTTSASR